MRHLIPALLFACSFSLLPASMLRAEQAFQQPPPNPIRSGDSVVVAAGGADLMDGSRVVAKIKPGETYKAIEVQGDWVSLKAGNDLGFVRAALLKKAPAPPRPPRPKSLESGARKARNAGGDQYAVLIGVKEYDATELKSLQFSESDIESIAEVLPGLGYAHENLMVLTQSRGASKNRLSPTADHIRNELRLILAEAGPKDTILVAMAGHGVQFKGEQDSFFCPSDANLSERKTLISLDEVYAALKDCKAASKVLMIDACRNDPQTSVSRGRATVELESVTRPQSAAAPSGVAAFFSCSAGQQAYEHPDLKHGVFFHYIIEGLKGRADFDQDAEITLAELELYAGKQVQRFVRNQLAAQQVPERRGEARGLVVLGRLKPVDGAR